MSVSISNIEKDRIHSLLKLHVSQKQIDWVFIPEEIINEANIHPFWHIKGIYLFDELIGFVVLEYNENENKKTSEFWLNDFLIDERFQGKGYGKKVLDSIIDHVKNDLHFNKIYLRVAIENIPARSLYTKIGFQSTNNFVEGGKEEIFALDI